MGLKDKILGMFFSKNDKEGTLIGRWLITLVPGFTLKQGLKLADMTLADVMENLVNNEGEKPDISTVTSAIRENKAVIEPFFLHFIAQFLDDFDFPIVDGEDEEAIEELINEHLTKSFDKYFEKGLEAIENI